MDPRLNTELEPPYGAIARAFRNGRVVPFLGAGVNMGGPQPCVQGDTAVAARLPSGAELSRSLANLVRFPADSDQDLADLAKVASYYV